jgi:hypothetical protein
VRKLVMAGGAVALTAGLSCAQPVDHLTQLIAARGSSASGSSVEGGGAPPTATTGPDRTPAQCVSVRLRSGRYVLRLQDLESGVTGLRGTPVADLVLTPSSASVPRPVAHRDVAVSRPSPWSGGAAFVRHINGAGLEGTCLLLSAADGSLTVRPWP